ILRGLIGDIELATTGVSITNLRGIGNLQKQKAVFSLARTAASWTLLIADPEGDAARQVRRLQQQNLLDPETTIIWERSFEEDNFTDEELADAIKRIARQRGIEAHMDTHDVRARYNDRRNRLGAAKAGGFARFLLAQVKGTDGRVIRISKPQLAKELA